MSDLARKVVFTMERLDSVPASVLRDGAYRAMTELGVDVHKLVLGARAEIIAERKVRAERSANSLQRLTEWAARVPELTVRVQSGPVTEVRDLLVAEKSTDEIQVLLGVERNYIKAVLDLNKARAAKRKLTDARKSTTRKHWDRLTRALQRPAWSSAPTKERAQQLGEGEEFVKVKMTGGNVRHDQQWPPDQIRPMLNEQEYRAAERLWNAHVNMTAVTVDANGARSDPARRLPVTPTQQQGHREWGALWPKLPTGLKYTAQHLIIRRPWTGEQKPLGFVGLGRKVGTVADEDQARGIGQGMLKATCAVLAQLSKDYDGWIKAHKRQTFKSILQHPDVLEHIVKGNRMAATSLMCKRTTLPAWIIQDCVKKAIEEAQRAPFPQSHKGAETGAYGAQKTFADAT